MHSFQNLQEKINLYINFIVSSSTPPLFQVNYLVRQIQKHLAEPAQDPTSFVKRPEQQI